MKLAAAKLFSSLQPNNLGLAVNKSANFFQRLFSSGGTRLIAEGNQSHDEDWTDATGRPVSAGRGHTISSCEKAALALFRQLVVSPVAKTSPNLIALIEMSLPPEAQKASGSAR